MRKFLADSLRRFRKVTPKEQSEGQIFRLKMVTEPEITPLKFDHRDLEPQEDYRANLNLYHEGLENIRAKYRSRVLKAFYVNGEELLATEVKRNDFCQKVGLTPEELERKIANYCQKNNISYEEMYLLKPMEDVDQAVKVELEKLIADEIYIEKVKFNLRDNNFLKESLEKSVDLATAIGRSDAEVMALQKVVTNVQEKGIGAVLRNGVKGKMTFTLLADLARDVNPLGERSDESNWQGKLDLFVDKLMRKGVYLDQKLEGAFVFEPEILATWDEVNEIIKTEAERKRGFERVLESALKKHPQVNLAYRAAVYEEQNQTGKTVESVKTAKENIKISPEQKMAAIKMEQANIKKNKKINIPGFDERHFKVERREFIVEK